MQYRLHHQLRCEKRALNPIFSMTAAVCPPPTTQNVAPDAALMISYVPREKSASSNRPAGPFNTTVPDDEILSQRAVTDSTPISRTGQSDGISDTGTLYVHHPA